MSVTRTGRQRGNARTTSSFKPRQRLGKYRIVRRIAEGGFAEIYEAVDTIEGVRVALRVPRAALLSDAMLEDFRREVRLVCRLEHPNILQVKSADRIDGHFVVSSLLGERTLVDELHKKLPAVRALEYGEQLLEALAYAHEQKVIHCDVKPDNVILFPGGRLRLTDFGIAKVVAKTMAASASGTVGYLAPEHALGKPTFRSDVFAAGLVIWELLTGALPEWPFEWPLAGAERLRGRLQPAAIEWLRKALEVDQRRRYADAGRMLAVYRKLKAGRKLLPADAGPRRAAPRAPTADLKTLRQKLFLKRFRRVLDLRHSCGRCGGAMSEAMQACPWCGNAPKRYRGDTRFPARCSRCGRGRKLDWAYCPWCHGPGFRTVATRRYPDKRYEGRCANPACTRKALMPFMRYCPWCRMKVRRRWSFPHAEGRCGRCGWGILRGFWEWCPWCRKRLGGRR